MVKWFSVQVFSPEWHPQPTWSSAASQEEVTVPDKMLSGFRIVGMQVDMVWCENLGNVAVLDLGCVGQLLPLDPLRGKA